MVYNFAYPNPHKRKIAHWYRPIPILSNSWLMSKLFFSYRLRPDKDVFDVCSDKMSACFLVSLSSESLSMRDREIRRCSDGGTVDGVVCKRDGIEEGRKGGGA